MITVFVAITANFFIPRLIPGDPITVMLSKMSITGAMTADGPELVEAYRKQFGLDGSWLTQYKSYILNLFQGDLGPSIMSFPTTVQELLITAIPWTIGLLAVATVISWILGNLLGALVGWRRESKTNSAILYLSLCLNQVPYYFIALILIFSLAYTLPIFPTTGAFSVIGTQHEGLRLVVDIVYHATLPALSIIISFILAIFAWPFPARTFRSQVLSSRKREYINMAKLSGLSDMKIVFKEILPNMLPYVSTTLANAISAAILAEVFLELLGLGPQNTITLGIMIYWAMERAALIRGVLWWVFPPMIVIVLIFISLQLINIGLDEVFNPRLRRGVTA